MNTDFYPLTVSHIDRLTPDAVAVTLDLPAELSETFQAIHGQHLTLKAQIDGKDIRRSYSICGGPGSQDLQVAIKRIEGGVFSTFANRHLKVGAQLEVMPPQGHFYTPLDAQYRKHYLLLAVGSGITPNLAHLQAILQQEPESRVTLIYGNRSTPLMMFREQLSFIKNRYLSRFNWIKVFSREDAEAELLNGRIDAEKLQQMHDAHLLNLERFDEVFVCGPEAMIERVVAFMRGRGLASEQVHYELFFADSAEKRSEQKMAARSEKYHHKVAQVALKVSGRTTRLEVAMDGGSILDAAVEAGADVPYACKSGVCATCKAKVVSGQVEMDQNHSLTEDEMAAGMILTCQAHPSSAKVDIDFDFAP